MLFNSYIFIGVFLPITLGLFYLCRSHVHYRAGMLVLVLASLVFYAFWSPKDLLLLLGLVVFNYVVGQYIMHFRASKSTLSKGLLIVGVAINLGTLGVFKYAGFVAENLNGYFGIALNLPKIVLPIGISFFTFQKIAFLVDVYRSKASRVSFLDYLLFVTFFPQLIAGPITHHSELIPQFTKDQRRVTPRFFQVGITFFTIGLAKKVILADTAAKFVSNPYKVLASGDSIGGLQAWSAALAYNVQLYFDFSAYSDMAIGLGLLFGIKLPLNFNSPYKATNIIEFWRRWHMTLSRFLRDYLYIALGGNRHGHIRRYLNLLLTMALGGLWHGAGWTFLVWGLLHGTYLILNHGWRAFAARSLSQSTLRSQNYRSMCWVATFLGVTVAWVFFRAPNMQTAIRMLQEMVGMYGWTNPKLNLQAVLVTLALITFACVAPNTQQIMGYTGPESSNKIYHSAVTGNHRRWIWSPSMGWALGMGVLLALSIMTLSKITEFIYFQF